MRFLRSIALFVVTQLVLSVFGYSQSTIWAIEPKFFVDFSTGVPVVSQKPNFTHHPVTGSQTSLTVVDEQGGDVLFHINGEGVYNSTISNTTFTLMPNGKINEGQNSAVQGIVCLHDDAVPHLYHLFNISSKPPLFPLTYLTVDMTADQGRGDVTYSEEVQYDLTEQIVAYPHPCGGYWIITHQRNSNRFLVYRFIDGTIEGPIISEVGTSLTFSGVGTLRLSNDGRHLVLHNLYSLMEFFSFNVENGTIEFVKTYYNSGNDFNYLIGEFSSNDRYYYTYRYSVAGVAEIVQIDLEDFSNMTEYVLGNLQMSLFDAFNMAPDGKIYIAHRSNNTIACIENPDNPGSSSNFNPSCFYVDDIWLPGSRNHSAHFPKIQKIVNPPAPLSLPTDTLLCLGDSLTLDYSQLDGTFLWDDFSTEKVKTISTQGTYIAQYTTSQGCTYSDTLVVTIEPLLTIDRDTFVCQGQFVVHNQDTFSIGESYTDIIPSDCPSEVTTTIRQYPLPFVGSLLPADTTLCWDQTLLLDYSQLQGTFDWSDQSTANTFAISQSGSYHTQYTSLDGCTYLDTLVVTIEPLLTIDRDTFVCQGQFVVHNQDTFSIGESYTDIIPSADCPSEVTTTIRQYPLPFVGSLLPADTTLCWDQTLLLDYSQLQGTFDWSDQSTANTFAISQSGSYHTQYTSLDGCTYLDTLVVTIEPLLTIDRDTFVCQGQFVVHNQDTFSIGESYTDIIPSADCPTEVTTTIRQYPLPFVGSLLPTDTTLCLGQNLLLNPQGIFANFTWSDGFLNLSRIIEVSGVYVLEVNSLEGCSFQDTLFVSFEEQNFFTIDTTICFGDELEFGGIIANIPGQYTDTLSNPDGCIELVTINLTVEDSATLGDTLTVEILEGQSFEWNSQSYSESGIYSVETVSEHGCESVDYLYLNVLKQEVEPGSESLFLPNILHLSGSMLNSSFTIGASDPSAVIVEAFSIFDRWGNCVFKTNESQTATDFSWNPSDHGDLLQGVYVYYIHYSRDGKSENLVGDITLIR